MTRSQLEDPREKTKAFERRTGVAVQLYRDRTTTWLVMLFGALVVFIVLALIFGRFARSEAVRGYVSAASGLSRLDAQVAGTVTDIAVKQGDSVEKGERLIGLSLRETTTGGVSTVGANLQSLRNRFIRLTEDRDRLTTFLATAKRDRDELAANTANVAKAMDAEEASLKVSLQHQNEMVGRVRAYLKQGYATRDALLTQERMAFDYDRQITNLRAKRAELQQQSAERLLTQRISVEEKQSQLSSTQSELGAARAQLAETSAKSKIDIVAPVSGQIVGMFVEPGTSVSADQILTTIGDPKAAPIIVLNVPARAIGLAKVGQDVVIKYDAFPFKTFGIAHGKVTYISSTPMRAPGTSATETLDARANSNESTYRVEVQPESNFVRAYGRDEPLRLGSTLSADIVIERRRLIDWVLDPIKALRGRG